MDSWYQMFNGYRYGFIRIQIFQSDTDNIWIRMYLIDLDTDVKINIHLDTNTNLDADGNFQIRILVNSLYIHSIYTPQTNARKMLFYMPWQVSNFFTLYVSFTTHLLVYNSEYFSLIAFHFYLYCILLLFLLNVTLIFVS